MFYLWPVATIIAFYLFALLQSSFFIYFSLFGVVPNFVFILFFCLIFFGRKDSRWHIILPAILAGFLLDAFSAIPMGISIILLTIIGFFVKKMQSMLKDSDKKYPFWYFVWLFLVSFAAYLLAIKLCAYFIGLDNFSLQFNIRFISETVYNLIFALIGFYLGKKLCKPEKNKNKNCFF